MQPERELTFRAAALEAIAEEMRRDPAVVMMGEDIGKAGGVFQQTAGLFDEFGPERIIDTPISEAAGLGIGVGAAMTGLRPIFEVMFGDFITLVLDQLANQAAKIHYMYGGQIPVPLVVRTTLGAGSNTGPQHSQSLHSWVCHIPGLKVAIPSTPYDAKGLFKTAIRDNNPVVFYEDRMSYGIKGPVPKEDYLIPFGQADVKRPGSDITVVATSSMVQVALAAAETLDSDGISVEVVDPRTLVPLDADTLIASARKTSRALVLDEGCRQFGAAAELAAVIAEGAFYQLDAPVARVAALDTPVPFSPSLEGLTIPNEEQVVEKIRGMVR